MQRDFRCDRIFTLVAVTLFATAGVAAQTGRVAMRGSISETVALSVVPSLTHGNFDTDILSSGNTVRITLSGGDVVSPVIRVTLLLRSNSNFKILAAVESKSADVTQLSIVDVHPTGALVSPQVISALNVPPQFDSREVDENSSPTNSSLRQLSSPFLLVSGPRVSLGGALNSPNNALQITVLIRMKPQPASSWWVQLRFAGTAASAIQ